MSNRNTRIGLLILLLFLISFTADAMGYTTSLTLAGGLDVAAQPSVTGLTSIMTTFFNLLTFQITGIPAFLSLVMWIIVVWLLLDFISVLKGLIPFTNGE